MTAAEGFDDPLFLAAVDLIGRSGSESFQIRYQDDEQPTVWMALAKYIHPTLGIGWEVGAGFDPTRAALRLLDEIIDGGTCTHCGKPTGVIHDTVEPPPFASVCWFTYDPELKTFRRGCEGD